MPVVALYMTKVFICLAAVFIFYRLLLKGLTFYNLNRWYLLGYSLLSFFIPLINISKVVEASQWSGSTVVRFIPPITDTTNKMETAITDYPASTWGFWDIVLFVYLTGVLVMFIRISVQWLSYRAMKRRSKLITNDRYKVYQVDEDIIPFSFGRSVFINPNLHSEAELKQILEHEYVHVREKHTIDILWAEVLCVLCWCNPFAWMIRHSIRQNLEYIADENVVANGIQKKHYQYLLLKVFGIQKFNIATPFNYSPLKNRIVMMNKIRSKKFQTVKFLFVLPVVLLLLLAFRDTITTPDANSQQQNLTISGLVFDAITNKPLSNVQYKEPTYNIAGSTDERGYFTARLSNVKYPLKVYLAFTKEGFQNIEAKVQLENKKNHAEIGFLEFIGMSTGNNANGQVHGMPLSNIGGNPITYDLVMKNFEHLNRSRDENNALLQQSAGSDKPYWVINGHSYLISAGGGMASVSTVTDIVIVDGKKMTGKEVNEKYTKDKIHTIGAVDKEVAVKKYGINQDVLEIYINTKPSDSDNK